MTYIMLSETDESLARYPLVQYHTYVLPGFASAQSARGVRGREMSLTN